MLIFEMIYDMQILDVEEFDIARLSKECFDSLFRKAWKYPWQTFVYLQAYVSPKSND